MSQSDAEDIRCTDGCGQSSPDPEASGWTHLATVNRWRCPICAAMLRAHSGDSITLTVTIPGATK